MEMRIQLKIDLLNNNVLKIHSIDFLGSICDGPGIRTVIYFQGCNRNCKGCHNPQTWNIDEGTGWDVVNLADYISQNSKTKRVTISGGEPLLQKEALLHLIRLLEGYDIAIYTGFNMAEVPLEIIKNVNYIKTGEFIQKLQSSIKPYIGSTNQKFIVLRSGD